MRVQALLLAAAAALTAGSAQAASVEIRDAVVRVTVIPEARSDVKVEILNPNDKLPLTVRVNGDHTVIDGDLHRRIRDCNGMGERARIRVRDVGQVGWDEMPHLVIHTPRDVEVSANGAVSGTIGRSAGVALSNSGCSSWTIADVAGDVDIHESGAGSVRMGAAERLTVHLSGAGSIRAVRINQGLEARLSGAGGVKIGEFSGPIEAQVSGVGGIDVESGRASRVRATISGMGGIEFGGVADSLDASVSGIGSVRVKSVRGDVSKSISGIGKVTIEDRT